MRLNSDCFQRRSKLCKNLTPTVLTLFGLDFLRVARLEGGGGGECQWPITLKPLMIMKWKFGDKVNKH